MFDGEVYTLYDAILVLLIITIIIFIYYAYLRPMIFERLYDNQTILLLIERSLLILATTILVYTFISVNPLVNGLITICFIFFGRDILNNFLHGILLIRELKLREGKSIKVGQQTGLISRLSYTGIQLTNGSNTEFIPFKKAYNNGVKEDKSDNATLITMFCDIPQDEKKSKTELLEQLEAKLFSLPFIIHNYKPRLDIQNDTIKVQIGIDNYHFKNSLIDAIEQMGFTVRIA